MIDRRQFLKVSAGLGALTLLGATGLTGCKQTAVPARQITLPSLPYSREDLAPWISAQTLDVHYGKHHQGYVNNANNLLKDTPLAKLELKAIIQETYQNDGYTGIFNNTAQVFNHTFYWHSMTPDGGGVPEGELATLLETSFGSYQNFYDEFAHAALTQFASGWAWLVQDGTMLKIIATSNADTPLARDLNPLLTIDVWEHAYYLDYQNRRADYITAWLDHLVNWKFAADNLI